MVEKILKKFRVRTYILIIVFIGMALYARGLTNAFVGDDYLQILQNYKVHSFANFPSFFAGSTYETAGGSAITGVFYRPIMLTVFSLLYSLFGPNPLFFHLTQLLLHITVVICLFLFLRKFFPDVGAFLLSLVFLVHPGITEGVLFSADLQEILYVLFGMVALLLVQKKELTSRKKWIIPLMLLLSLFSKESGILFIILVIIYSWIFERKRFKFVAISSPIALGIFLFFRYALAHMYHANTSLAPIANLPLSQRLMHIPIIILYYIKLFFYPAELSTYQHWVIHTISFGNFWLPLFVDVLFFSLLILGYRWIARKNNPQKKACIFFFIWLVIGLGLHLQIIPLDVTVADRWFYFIIIGLLGIGGVLIRQIPWNKVKTLSISIVVVILVLLSIRTYIRIGDWQNELTLFGHDSRYQSNFILSNSYGAALIQDGQFEKAKTYVAGSIREHPYTANVNNMAIILVSEENIPKAKEYFKKALNIGETPAMYENYANFLLYYDSPREALKFSENALKIYPESPKLLLVYGEVKYMLGATDSALHAVAKSYEIFPNDGTLAIFSTMRERKPLVLKRT